MGDSSISLKPAVTQKAVAYFGDQLKVAGKNPADFKTIQELQEFVGGNEDLQQALKLVTEDGKRATPTFFYATFLALQQEEHPTQQYLRSSCEHFTPEEPPAKDNEEPGPRKVRPSISERALEGKGFFDDGMPDGGCY